VSGVVFAASPHQPEIAPAVPPSHAVSLAALGIAVVLVLGIWEITAHAVVIAHEGAHAAAALLLGGVPTSVTVNEKNEGLTEWRGAPILPVLAGYSGPPLFGLLGAALLVHGSATAVLWIFLLMLGLLLIVVRSVFSLLIVGGLAALLYLTVTYGSASAQVIVVCTLVWILLVGGAIQAFEHFKGGGDYTILKSKAGLIPKIFWASISVVVAVGSLLLGGAWLLGYGTP
jgi:Peptidase M50B-like